MTESDFLAFYPQFSSFAGGTVLETFIASAACRFSDFHEDAEEARRLYVAHKLTLWARTRPAETDSEVSYSSLSSAGEGARIISKKVGEVAVTYASGTTASLTTTLTDLGETEYGVQLLTLLRLYSYPRYVP